MSRITFNEGAIDLIDCIFSDVGEFGVGFCEYILFVPLAQSSRRGRIYVDFNSPNSVVGGILFLVSPCTYCIYTLLTF